MNDPAHDPAQASSRTAAQRELGAAQVSEFLELQLAGDRLPSARAWMKMTDQFVGSRALLAHLRTEETLPLRPIACEELRRGRFLMAPCLAERCALVQVAVRSQMYGGRPEFEPWLRRRVLSGIVDALHSEAEKDLGGLPVLEEERFEFALIEELFGVEPALARRLMLRFNGLEADSRGLMYEVVVRGRSLVDVAEQVGAETRLVVQLFDTLLEQLLHKDTSTPDFSAPWMAYADDLDMEDEL